MAKKLKCWKKNYDMESSISYSTSDREIQINKTDYGNRGLFAPKRKSKWGVFKFINNKPVQIIKNKSKQQAESFAKSYMKKHDVCKI